MNEERKVKINILLAAVILLGFFLFALFKPDQEISVSERRKLRSCPTPTMDNIFGKSRSSFMDEFELYAKDQFPLRESFRSINSAAGRFLLGRKEINDLYLTNGYLSKLEDGLHEKDLAWSRDCISSLIDRFAGDNAVYMAVIPDKNYYLAAEKGYPYLDSDLVSAYFEDRLADRADIMTLTDRLGAEDYYYTDTHWRQEKIIDLAAFLAEEMGGSERSNALQAGNLTENTASDSFFGVYYGQAALPLRAEKLNYLTWEGLEELTVTCYDSGSPVTMQMYELGKAEGMDPYEMFLGGSRALITIENPAAPEGELVLFRDSFGSSIAPLLARAYQKVTLVDIRYISPAAIERFVDFADTDILFLYCSSVLNNSIGQFIK